MAVYNIKTEYQTKQTINGVPLRHTRGDGMKHDLEHEIDSFLTEVMVFIHPYASKQNVDRFATACHTIRDLYTKVKRKKTKVEGSK